MRWAAAAAALALAVPVALVAARGGDEAGRVTIAADQRSPAAGERVALKVRVGGDPPAGARLVVLVRRLAPAGAASRRSLRRCPAGARACVVRVRSGTPGRVRYRAVLRLGGRAVRASRPLTISWRAPAAVPGAPGAGPAPPPGAAPPGTPPRPLPGLPEFTAGFEGWTRLNAVPIPPDSPAAIRVGTDAHRGTKDVYVNVAREVALTRPFPAGTVVVKAVRRGSVPGYALVATMRRVAGADPAHGDWRFVEYAADGRGGYATGPGLSGASCWGCHAIAADTDWVFTPTD